MAKTKKALQAVEVDGISVMVDVTKLTSWKFAQLSAKAADASLDDDEKFPAVMELIDLVLGESMDEVIEALGGDDAQLVDVMDLFSKVMEVVRPKS